MLSFTYLIEKDLFKSSACQQTKHMVCLNPVHFLHRTCQISLLQYGPGEEGKQSFKSNLGGSAGTHWAWLLWAKGSSAPPPAGFPMLKVRELRGAPFVMCRGLSMCGVYSCQPEPEVGILMLKTKELQAPQNTHDSCL